MSEAWGSRGTGIPNLRSLFMILQQIRTPCFGSLMISKEQQRPFTKQAFQNSSTGPAPPIVTPARVVTTRPADPTVVPGQGPRRGTPLPSMSGLRGEGVMRWDPRQIVTWRISNHSQIIWWGAFSHWQHWGWGKWRGSLAKVYRGAILLGPLEIRIWR